MERLELIRSIGMELNELEEIIDNETSYDEELEEISHLWEE